MRLQNPSVGYKINCQSEESSRMQQYHSRLQDPPAGSQINCQPWRRIIKHTIGSFQTSESFSRLQDQLSVKRIIQLVGNSPIQDPPTGCRINWQSRQSHNMKKDHSIDFRILQQTVRSKRYKQYNLFLATIIPSRFVQQTPMCAYVLLDRKVNPIKIKPQLDKKVYLDSFRPCYDVKNMAKWKFFLFSTLYSINY